MTENHSVAIGRLQADSKTSSSNISSLFKSNEKRKQENTDTLLNINSMQHTVEETKAMASQVVEFMEQLKQSIDEIKTSVSDIDLRVSAIEGMQFNWPKFMRGAGSKQGLLIIFMVCSTLIILTLARNAPETLPQFFDLIKAAK